MIGMIKDRIGLPHPLATLPKHPESLPINALIPVSDTKLGDLPLDRQTDDLELVRTAAAAQPDCSCLRQRPRIP